MRSDQPAELKTDSRSDAIAMHGCRWHGEVADRATAGADAISTSFTRSTATPSTGRSTTPAGTSASTDAVAG